MDELKPCPFCGSPAELIRKYVACSSNHCYASETNIPIAEWNARPLEDVLQAELAAVKAENAKLREALETIATPSVEYDNNTLQAIRHIAKMVSIAKTALGVK